MNRGSRATDAVLATPGGDAGRAAVYPPAGISAQVTLP